MVSVSNPNQRVITENREVTVQEATDQKIVLSGTPFNSNLGVFVVGGTTQASPSDYTVNGNEVVWVGTPEISSGDKIVFVYSME